MTEPTPASDAFSAWFAQLCSKPDPLPDWLRPVVLQAAASTSRASLAAAVISRPDVTTEEAQCILERQAAHADVRIRAAWLLRPEAHRPTAVARIREDALIAEPVVHHRAARDEHLQAAIQAVRCCDGAAGTGQASVILAEVAIHPNAATNTRTAALVALDDIASVETGVRTGFTRNFLLGAAREAGVAARSALLVNLKSTYLLPELAAQGQMTPDAAEAVLRNWVLPTLERYATREDSAEGASGPGELPDVDVVRSVVNSVALNLPAENVPALQRACLDPRLPVGVAESFAQLWSLAVDWGDWPAQAVLLAGGRPPVAAWLTETLSTLGNDDLATFMRLAPKFAGTFSELVRTSQRVTASALA